MDFFLNTVKEFEERIGLRPGFFNELVREDDWSFVIKLHAFLEACLTNAICSTLGRPELERVIARLDTSNSQSGKLAFARQLNLLNKSQRRFFVIISELRNSLAHNVRAVDFTFEEYMQSLTEEQRHQFCVALSLDEMFAPESEPDKIGLISYVHDVPKFGIGLAAALVASELYLGAYLGDLNQNFQLIGKRLVERSIGDISVAER